VEIEVCEGTVLPGSGCAEHQTIGAISTPVDYCGGHHLRREQNLRRSNTRQTIDSLQSFSTPRPVPNTYQQLRSKSTDISDLNGRTL
jgi:hypothetical protein